MERKNCNKMQYIGSPLLLYNSENLQLHCNLAGRLFNPQYKH